MTKSASGEIAGSKAYHQAMLDYYKLPIATEADAEKVAHLAEECGIFTPDPANKRHVMTLISDIRRSILRLSDEKREEWFTNYQKNILLLDGWKVGDIVRYRVGLEPHSEHYKGTVWSLDPHKQMLRVINHSTGVASWVYMEWCYLEERP